MYAALKWVVERQTRMSSRRQNSLYDHFEEGPPFLAISKRKPHTNKLYVHLRCPYCSQVFNELTKDSVQTNKASTCKAHLLVCAAYTDTTNQDESTRWSLKHKRRTQELDVMYQSDRIAREEAERRLKEAERKLQEKEETEARNDARHDEVMAQLTLVRTQLSDVETQLSDKRQCLTDVREWGRLKEPDNTLVPQLTCREATLVASHETEASRLRAELEVLRVAIKDKAPVSLVTRAAEAEDKYARLRREWEIFRETNERDVAAALRASDQERAQHGAAKLAYTERARTLKRKLQAATHPDKVPVEVRQWATRVFQQVFEPVP